jgi:hypothetical protein
VDALSRDVDVGDVEGLGGNQAIDRLGEQDPKLRGVYIGRCQEGFVAIQAGTQVVIVLGEHVHLGKGWERKAQTQKA